MSATRRTPARGRTRRIRPDHETAPVERLIKTVRGTRVVLAWDLAKVYGVETRTLNQAIRRNAERFPSDFAFRLTRREVLEMSRSRSQSVILKRGQNIKYRPLVFTEHGVIMAASILNSPRAIQMSVFVVRAFLRLREWASNQAKLSARLAEIERRVGAHDRDLQAIIKGIRQLMTPPATSSKRIGFAPAKPVGHGSFASSRRRS